MDDGRNGRHVESENNSGSFNLQKGKQKYALPIKDWQQFVEDNYQKQGTGKSLKEYNLPTKEDVKTKFGALYNAFQYGTPPHAGAAPGLDRMVMLIADSKNIREVIAFPKNKKARDVMMGAPSRVNKAQLDDVHICLLYTSPSPRDA